MHNDADGISSRTTGLTAEESNFVMFLYLLKVKMLWRHQHLPVSPLFGKQGSYFDLAPATYRRSLCGRHVYKRAVAGRLQVRRTRDRLSTEL